MKKIRGLLAVFVLLYSLPMIFAGDDKQVVVDLETPEMATFAGGCFWCMQPPYDKLDGVVKTTVGYTGGQEKNPTYKQVSFGKITHTESVVVVFDPAVVSYEQLLDVFWRQFDPTDAGGSFYDRGHHYTSAIFYHNEHQRELAEAAHVTEVTIRNRVKRFNQANIKVRF